MSLTLQVLFVFLGGALGAAGRYWVSGIVARRAGETFPWGTLVVNVSGAFLLGLLAGVVLAVGTPNDVHAWPFLAVGVLGSYTTVSSFSLQTFELIRGDELREAFSNVILSFVLCLAAAAAGLLGGLAFAGT